MSAKCFLDTNVLFYACDSSDSKKQATALKLVTELSSRGDGVLSAQVLGEFFHATVIRKKLLTAAEAQKLVQQYANAFPIATIDSFCVSTAMEIHKRFQTSYWDSLIIATARREQCGEILSEDLSDGQVYEGVKVVNPFKS